MVERFYGRTAVKGLHVIVSIVSVSEREKERANKGGNKRAIERTAMVKVEEKEEVAAVNGVGGPLKYSVRGGSFVSQWCYV